MLSQSNGSRDSEDLGNLLLPIMVVGIVAEQFQTIQEKLLAFLHTQSQL